MSTTPNCFVIIGYGKKTSYINGKVRLLDLDETFSVLIKPVFDGLKIPCYRAIDKNVNGSIDKLMLQEIKNADIALVDISTLNANVMWELGVRHALKPRHTIMICEKEQMAAIPFDVNHFVVHTYTHSEEGIPYKEVERFRTALTEIVKRTLAQDPTTTDSPVHTFLKDEMDTKAAPAAGDGTSFLSLMQDAEKAKNSKNFELALELFVKAETVANANQTLRDNLPLIISRQALCTYKSKKPTEQEALMQGREILNKLNPLNSQDVEVLGLSGAINKRLNEITDDITYLDQAIWFYEKGFQLKQDYYNGINTAFMLYKKAAILKGKQQEWDDVKLKADYLRNSVLEICLALEAAPAFSESTDSVWVLNSMAEAYNYKKNPIKMKEYEDKALLVAEKNKDEFAITSYNEQKEKIKHIFEGLNQ